MGKCYLFVLYNNLKAKKKLVRKIEKVEILQILHVYKSGNDIA